MNRNIVELIGNMNSRIDNKYRYNPENLDHLKKGEFFYCKETIHVKFECPKLTQIKNRETIGTVELVGTSWICSFS
ncbi:hypothetical protein AYI69_g2134 [Smittium culicis]|uniref:Uncharacterized protein n=1 Tax=Smittium culicis TaxID=133412 RepID=A0A1R1YNH3_9FUNG|nr:hypothetical protein AYI69_g2134 [Smittium culicis]